MSYKFHADCGADCQSFELNQTSGYITANRGNFDSSQQNTYRLRIVAQDGAASSLPHTTGPNQGMSNVSGPTKVRMSFVSGKTS